MSLEFDENIEYELTEFVQKNYGFEIFTPGLERTRSLFLPFVNWVKTNDVKVTIIAGTNGKGQTAHTLTYLLNLSKLNVALWTSPHILSLRERFVFTHSEMLTDISYDFLRSEIYQTHDFLKREYSELKVSFYEFLFLVFLKLAQKEKRDHLVLEIGLGGKLDAVNHLDADLACITSISRDHQAILGNRFDLILAEKIAVARPGKPLFTNFKSSYLNQLTAQHCRANSVEWHKLNNSANSNYFLENQQMAMALYGHYIPIEQSIRDFTIPSFKGRREEMTFKGNTLIFIGAHNIDGVRRMIELFDQNHPSFDYLLVSFSKRPIIEVEVMLKSLLEFCDDNKNLRLTVFKHPKALELEIIKELFEDYKISKGMLDFVTDWKSELIQSKNKKILVCGSYYFIGEVQRFILTHF